MSDFHISVDINIKLPKELLNFFESVNQSLSSAEKPEYLPTVKEETIFKSEKLSKPEQVEVSIKETTSSKLSNEASIEFDFADVSELIKKALKAHFGDEVRKLLEPYSYSVPKDRESLQILGIALRDLIK